LKLKNWKIRKMEYSDEDFRMFFQECYEEKIIVDMISKKLKTWSDGLDEALDKIEKDERDSDESC